MNKIYCAYNQLIVFSEWTGKGYAVFSALKKVIKIANLKIDLCVLALQKLKKTIADWIFYETLDEQQHELEFDLLSEEQLLNFVSAELIDAYYYCNRINLPYNTKSTLINFISRRLFLCPIS